ncbi:hypothetical protein HYALB_00000316 [Hymenoscyphus albidus]|uniref:Arylamine N-acetyltransferase n=1 Tax=Hymenoscyphus albidus TaxID=595503 RepID=A0A9N9LV71_9HELO|nr:hypothetical protein HYALB_00000316 [Hymenoscyphus albidus]
MANRTYSSDQLGHWEECISLPPRFRRLASPILDLEYLITLHTHQIVKIPYENLSLHYTPTPRVSLNPQDLFQKIVGNARGRGGYCMEGSIFFNSILRSLGFKVERGVGVPQGKYDGWVHIVNIVTLPDGSKYSVDVAFGGDGQVVPLPLTPFSEEPPVFTNFGSQQIRLIHAPVPPENQESPAATQSLSSQYAKFVDEEPQRF